MTMPLVDLAISGFILFAVIMRDKVFEDVRESPVEWGAFEGIFACEVEATNSRTHFKEYSEVYTRQTGKTCMMKVTCATCEEKLRINNAREPP